MKTANDLLELSTSKAQTRLTPELRIEVEKAIMMNISNKDIARYFELTTSRVSQIKKEMNQ